MPYLKTDDYKRFIQTTELNQLTGGDASIRQLVEMSVEAEIRSWLIQRYNLTNEFQATQQWLNTVAYKGGNRIYLDALPYSITEVYVAGDVRLQAGNVYRSIAGNVAHAFNAAEWTLVGAQYTMFYAQLPNPAFDQTTYYRKGDKVFYKDKNYTAAVGSMVSDHESALNAGTYENINNTNIFPDDPVNGLRVWGVGVAYSVPAATLPTNATYFTHSDSRNQLFVAIYIDMVIYELCKRIAPGNIPEARHNAWLRALENLKKFAKEDITAELPLVQDGKKQGSAVRFGGQVKNINQW